MAERRIAARSLAFVAVLGVSHAAAEPIDPTLPARRVVGAPAAAAPMARLNGARNGRASSPLPSEPRVLWRARITGGLELPPAVDAKGRAVLASSGGRLSQLDEHGKLGWTARTGTASIVLGPVITSDATRVVATTAAELYGIGADGSVKYRRQLPFPSLKAGPPPLASSDGGVVIAVAGSLLRLDAGGALQSRAVLRGTPVTILEQGARVLVVSAEGDVVEWQPPAEPSKLASFGGRVEEGAALLGPGHVTAVVDQRRVVDLGLSDGTRQVRVDSTELLQGPPVLLPNGETRVASFAGLMLGHDRKGAETARVALEPAGLPGGTGVGGYSVPPALITDEKSQVGFVRPGLDAAVVTKAGELRSASGAACGDPIALLPAGRGRMLLACRSGLVVMLGSK